MNELMATIAHDFWTWFGLPPEPVGEQLDADEKALGVDRRRYLQRVLMARYTRCSTAPGGAPGGSG